MGTPALYLALTIEGMFLEMGHGFGYRFEPMTVCCYYVDCDDILDLRTDAGRTAAGVRLKQMNCAWAYDRDIGRTPASWTTARKLIRMGASGILTPSFATGARTDMVNLVLWKWNDELSHQVAVHDPNQKLPKDPRSWSK